MQLFHLLIMFIHHENTFEENAIAPSRLLNLTKKKCNILFPMHVVRVDVSQTDCRTIGDQESWPEFVLSRVSGCFDLLPFPASLENITTQNIIK